MRRRAFLAAGSLAALSGCVVGHAGEDDGLPVPLSALRGAAARDAIPAITDPAFAPDWSGTVHDRGGESRKLELRREDPVIGLERAGRARAYPLKVLTWHEVVNDDLGGPLLVTYCPLCRSGVVARRTVLGEPTLFGVSGYLYRGNLVMYDAATESLWSQLRALAIRGPATGAELAIQPSTLATWGAWREAHPDTEVLLPAPDSDTVLGEVSPPYGFDYYEQRAETAEHFGLGESGSGTLPKRMLVLGIAHGGEATAYPQPAVAQAGAINDVVGGLPMVVTTDGAGLVAYDRRVGDRTLTFSADPLRAGGSRFDPVTGRARDGPLAGTVLERLAGATPMYWFTWHDFHPDTRVFGRGSA